jgi:very-short-patch-repair endonuclease
VTRIERHSDIESRPPLWPAVAELAERQWGVVSRAALQDLGVSAAGVGSWVRRKRLHVVHRGVYAVGHARLGREGRRLAAVLACGPGAVLSHLSAASHWGLLHTAQTRIDVTAAPSRDGVLGIRLHRSRSLGARDTANHAGIPTTSVARTLLDLAATVHRDRLERALAQAQRLRLYDHRAIHDVLARAHGHRGRTALTRATASEAKLTRSELEARFLALARDAGLSEPLTNFTLTAPDHPRIEVDFYWPAHRLVVETDGWETHRTRAAFRSDRRRDAALVAAGCRVLRFTYDDVVDEPATTQRRLRAAAARRR